MRNTTGGFRRRLARGLCLVLCLALVAAFPVAASAADNKGPYGGYRVFDDGPFYPAFLYIWYTDGKGEEQSIPLWEPNGESKNAAGAVYDLASNTLTLTDFSGDYSLSANMMGTDFTLRIRGKCALSHIRVWGEGYGGNLRITGDGSLVVNGSKKESYGIDAHPEGTDFTLNIESGVKVKICGSEGAVAVNATTYEEYENPELSKPGSVSFISGGKKIALTGKTAEREKMLEAMCFARPYDGWITVADYEWDHNGIYGWVSWEEEGGKTVISVSRYLYFADRDVYVPDVNWATEHGFDGEDGIRFSSWESAAQLGFSPKYDGDGYEVYRELRLCTWYGYENLYFDAAGALHPVYHDFVEYDGEYMEVLISGNMVPIPFLGDNAYFVNLDASIDPYSLTEAIVTEPCPGYTDYVLPDKVWMNDASAWHYSGPFGDVDGDDEISVKDARLCLRRAINLESYPPSSREYIACNVDGDLNVTVADARLILRVAIKLDEPESFPAGY